MANWSTYRTDPLFLFMAPFLKPDADPRSRFQFAADNYGEVIKLYIDKVVAVALTPVYQIFGVLSSSIGTAAGGLGAIKALLAKLFHGFQDMVDIFMKRFGTVGHALTNTFRQLLQALQHVWASAVASLYSGLSVVYAMQNTMQLMINIVITILIILAVMIFFFFFALWPLLPLIVLGGVMVNDVTSTLGLPNDGSDAISSLACFHPTTRVVMADGSETPLHAVRLGDVLEGGGLVEGLLRFETPAFLYSLDGVLVTGSHIVWVGDTPTFVQDHTDARPHGQTTAVLCLLTSNRRIPVRSTKGRLLQFADWEELDDDEDAALQAWHDHVDVTLNGTPSLRRRSKEEAGCSGTTPVATPTGPRAIREIKPGMRVGDGNGQTTTVTGLVTLLGGPCNARASSHGILTTGCWVRDTAASRWAQPQPTDLCDEPVWYHLFTDAGTFQSGTIAVRDFSDVGRDLPTTYPTTLAAMTRSSKNRDP